MDPVMITGRYLHINPPGEDPVLLHRDGLGHRADRHPAGWGARGIQQGSGEELHILPQF